jgi:hypothetical protein
MALWMVKGLLVVYIVILIVSLVEKDYKLALYWGGATLLQAAVIWMRQG